MRKELPDCLRSVARDFDTSGPQYAALSALLREAADELQKRMQEDGATCFVAPPVPVVDGDGPLPLGRPCISCDE